MISSRIVRIIFTTPANCAENCQLLSVTALTIRAQGRTGNEAELVRIGSLIYRNLKLRREEEYWSEKQVIKNPRSHVLPLILRLLELLSTDELLARFQPKVPDLYQIRNTE